MKLFWRIFLSFWLAVILMVGFVLIKGEILPLTLKLPGDREGRFEPELAASALTKAADAYEQHGSEALSSYFRNLARFRHRSVYLFDAEGKLLAGNGTTPGYYSELAREVSRSGHAGIQHVGFRSLFVCPIQSATGQHYAAILTSYDPAARLLSLRLWLNLMIAMVPAAFVCMVLSHYLTRPISRLQATAQRLAGGDLSARADPPTTDRRDELGDLARDFDTMAAQIQSLMTAQRRFVADVSHELGAPLTRMHLALALMRRQFAEKSGGAMERIERETQKLSSLVQQLLLLAGLEAGARPVEALAPVSMPSLCESIIEDANFEAAQKNCRVTGSRQDVSLLAYPNLLRRAIDNVLRNAIRYALAGTEIQLNCRADDNLQFVILEVLDCGPGVPESMLSDIFRPFFRTAPGRESSSGGTGLGLAIASEAVALHEGKIIAQNRKPGGLQVTITLPLRTVPREEALQHTMNEA